MRANPTGKVESSFKALLKMTAWRVLVNTLLCATCVRQRQMLPLTKKCMQYILRAAMKNPASFFFGEREAARES